MIVCKHIDVHFFALTARTTKLGVLSHVVVGILLTSLTRLLLSLEGSWLTRSE
jgi:hypothetical protein